MFGISFAELAVIVLLILVVMGPEKIPEVARWAGKGMREIRQASNALRDALMIDEITGQKKLPTSPSTPPPVVSGQPTAPVPKAPETKTPQVPSQARPGLTGIDQMDPDEFDRFLEEQYQLHHKELRLVPLPLQKDGTGLRAVALEAALPADSHHSAPLAYCQAHELAS